MYNKPNDGNIESLLLITIYTVMLCLWKSYRWRDKTINIK